MTTTPARAVLALDVRWPAGRYYGKEWPPSPLRLFQALVAGAATPGRSELPAGAVSALDWLERAPPPAVIAPAGKRCARLYAGGAPRADARPLRPAPSVPRNSADRLMTMHAAGNSRSDIEAEDRKLHDLKPLVAWQADSLVRYCWPLRAEDAAAAQRVAALALELHALGRGIDFAYATAHVGTARRVPQGSLTWRPSPAGMALLEVPVRGTLQSVIAREEARQQRFARRDYVNAPIAGKRQRYSDGTDSAARPWRLFEIRRADGGSLASFPQQEAAIVVGMVRHALDQLHRDAPAVRAYATGHVDAADADARLSWWPLPSLGHAQADGRVRRVLVLGPPGSERGEEFAAAMFGLHAAPLQRAGRVLARLVESDALVPESLPGAVAPLFGRAAAWATVLPMVLPGRVSTRAGSRRRLVPRKVEALIQKSLLRAGLPPAVALRYQPAPFFPWGVGARDLVLPDHLRRDSTLLHVALEFAQDLTGPIAIGPGQHYGFGVLHPIAAVAAPAPPAPEDEGEPLEDDEAVDEGDDE
jgi:CRISPR-associated protein Csb2